MLKKSCRGLKSNFLSLFIASAGAVVGARLLPAFAAPEPALLKGKAEHVISRAPLETQKILQ